MSKNFQETELRRIRCDMEGIIRNEIEDGHKKIQESWHWGNVGSDVITASDLALAAIDPIVATDHESYFQTCMTNIHAAHLRFRRDCDDDSGYGSGTFHTIKSGLVSLAGQHGVTLPVPDLPDTIDFNSELTFTTTTATSESLNQPASAMPAKHSFFQKIKSILHF